MKRLEGTGLSKRSFRIHQSNKRLKIHKGMSKNCSVIFKKQMKRMKMTYFLNKETQSRKKENRHHKIQIQMIKLKKQRRKTPTKKTIAARAILEVILTTSNQVSN